MNERLLVLHELVDLVKGLAWPAVVLYCAVRYAREIRKLLGALDTAVRRLRGAKGFGVELELEAKIAEQTSVEAEREQAVKMPPEIKPPLDLAAKTVEQASIEAEREQALKTLPGIEPPNVKGASQ